MSERVVAITGGTKGIGRAVAELFLARGWRVAVCSRSRPEALWPTDILHVMADVTRQTEVDRFADTVQSRFGAVHAFVNNAGISRWQSIADVDDAFASTILNTNIMGTLWGCRAAARLLPPGGAIVNVSSLAGKRGSARNSVYCASKFAVNGITQSLAKELGPKGIRVNAICPVYVETETILDALEESVSPASGADVSDYLADFARTQTALGRLPTANEAAELVFFLAGTAASAITGQCINVDCGTLPQ